MTPPEPERTGDAGRRHASARAGAGAAAGAPGAAEAVMNHRPPPISVPAALLGVLTVIAGGWALWATYLVTMPLAFSFVLAVVVYPVQRTTRRRLPRSLRWISVLIPMCLIVLAFALGVGAMWLGLRQVTSKWSTYAEQLSRMWTDAIEWIRASGIRMPDNVFEVSVVRDQLMSLLTNTLSTTWQFIAFLILVFFLIVLMLLETEQWRNKAQAAAREDRGSDVVSVVDEVAHKLRQYLLVRTVVSAVSGVSAGLWLWLLGVDFALFWGLLTFLLNYIPNIGSVISGIGPSLLALLQFGLFWGVITAAGLVAIEQVIGNFIDPRMQGRALSISPLVVLASIVLWGIIWGVVGALLAVPMTVIIIVVCAHVPHLRPIALLLSRTASPDVIGRQAQS